MYYFYIENQGDTIKFIQTKLDIEVSEGQIKLTEEEFKQYDNIWDYHIVGGELVKNQALINIKAEAEARYISKKEGVIYTLNGIEYKISFMKDDGDGVIQVKNAFDLGVTNTIIHFTNGTKMPITSSEFMEFAIWFANKRNNFFIEGNQ